MEKGKITRKVTVSGGDHPAGMKWTFDVTVDYTNCPDENIMASAFAHDVVRAQNGQLRKMTAVELNALVNNGGITIAAETIGSGKRAAVDPMAAVLRKAPGMSQEELAKFIAQLEEMRKQAE